jgi:hypothetical protein
MNNLIYYTNTWNKHTHTRTHYHVVTAADVSIVKSVSKNVVPYLQSAHSYTHTHTHKTHTHNQRHQCTRTQTQHPRTQTNTQIIAIVHAMSLPFSLAVSFSLCADEYRAIQDDDRWSRWRVEPLKNFGRICPDHSKTSYAFSVCWISVLLLLTYRCSVRRGKKILGSWSSCLFGITGSWYSAHWRRRHRRCSVNFAVISSMIPRSLFIYILHHWYIAINQLIHLENRSVNGT